MSMNQKETEIHEYFNKKLLEIQKEDYELLNERQRLKDELFIINEKLKKNNDLTIEYFELQKKLRQP